MTKIFEQVAGEFHEEIVKTASELIQINSQSKDEGAMAKYTADKMRELGYDSVVVDRYGSVFGTVKGTGGGKSTTLNCHLDVVYEGDHSKWKYPPFSGQIAEGKVWGRGASDTKGTFAVQLYTPIMLKKAGLLPKGDIVVSGVISEEIAGFGAMMQTRDNFMLTDYVVIGEATENDLAISCRGRFCCTVTIRGKSCHASIPQIGKNPFDFLGPFLVELKKVEMGYDVKDGYSTLSPTAITSSEQGTNIIPNEIVLFLDYRQVACDTTDVAVKKIEAAAEKCKLEGITVEVKALYFPLTTYTGFEGEGFQGEPPFAVSEDADYVKLCKTAIEQAVGHEIKTKGWAFATDTGHFAAKGVKCIGYSPAEIKLCHTTEDNIDISMMREAEVGYMAMTCALCNQER
ncbi:MAG: M20/M25/M40 family metallo-hydrolase [Oscillospiraceae bacterium]